MEHVYAVDLNSPSDLFINATPGHVYSIRTNCNDGDEKPTRIEDNRRRGSRPRSRYGGMHRYPLACVDDTEDFSAYFSRGPYVDLMVDPGTYIVMLDTYESSASYTLDIDIEPTPLATP